jgi:iron complex outermembrane receptor protein
MISIARYHRCALLASVVLIWSGHTQAADTGATSPEAKAAADASPLEEIVVTARRRAENLQDVPVAVSVISAETITQRNIINPKDIATVTPGLQVVTESAHDENNQPVYSIRGQSGSDANAVYLGEVPDFTSLIFDIDNIQVLKGPQGTLFGRVTSGGAVLYSAAQPTNEWSGYAKITAGNYSLNYYDVALSGPIIPDVLKVRVAGMARQGGSFSLDLYNQSHYDGMDTQAFRVIADLTLGIVENNSLFEVERDNDPSRSLYLVGAVPLGTVTNGNLQYIPPSIAAQNGISCVGGCPTWLQAMQSQAASQNLRNKTTFDANAYGSPAFSSNLIGGINKTVVSINEHYQVRNILSYRVVNNPNGGPSDEEGVALPVLDAANVPSSGTRTFTEEAQLQASPIQKLQVTTGVFYQASSQPDYIIYARTLYGGFRTSVPTTDPSTCVAPNEYGSGYCSIYTGHVINLSKQNQDTLGPYAQGTYEILSGLRLTAGYRYTRITQTTWATALTSATLHQPGAVASQNYCFPGATCDLVPSGSLSYYPGVASNIVVDKKGTYNFTLDYKLADSTLIYGSTRTGYKPGGLNNLTVTSEHRYYDPQTVTDYELGVKTTWNVGGIAGVFNVDLYHDNFSNIQGNASAIIGGVPALYTTNVAKARIQGIDVDTTVKFSPAFDLTAFYSLTDANYTSWANGGAYTGSGAPATADLTQNMLIGVSRNRFGLTPSFHLKGLGLAYDITLSGNVYYQSTWATQSINVTGSPDNIVPGRTLANLRADWKVTDRVGAGFSVINVTNNEDQIGGINGAGYAGYITQVYNPPRTWYFDLKYSF